MCSKEISHFLMLAVLPAAKRQATVYWIVYSDDVKKATLGIFTY